MNPNSNTSATNDQQTTLQAQCRPDYVAGFRLLDKFQNQWEQIHSKSEKNVIKAKTAFSKLLLVEQSTARRLQALDELNGGFKLLSKLDDQINNIHSDLEVLEERFVQIEDLLIVLKNNKESNNTAQQLDTLSANYTAQVHEIKTMSRVRRAKMKQDHLKRVELYEKRQQKDLEERRIILERAFEEEKNRYLENKTKKT